MASKLIRRVIKVQEMRLFAWLTLLVAILRCGNVIHLPWIIIILIPFIGFAVTSFLILIAFFAHLSELHRQHNPKNKGEE